MALLIQALVLLATVGVVTASHDGCQACMKINACPSTFLGFSKHDIYNYIHHHVNPGPFGRRSHDRSGARTRRQNCPVPWIARGHCYKYLGEEESGWLTISIHDRYNREFRVWVNQHDVQWKCPHHTTRTPVTPKQHVTHAPTTTRKITHAPTTQVTKAPTPTTTPKPTTTTTEQPSTPFDTCIDVVDCEAYGKGFMCTQYPETAKVTCRKSCHYC